MLPDLLVIFLNFLAEIVLVFGPMAAAAKLDGVYNIYKNERYFIIISMHSYLTLVQARLCKKSLGPAAPFFFSTFLSV